MRHLTAYLSRAAMALLLFAGVAHFESPEDAERGGAWSDNGATTPESVAATGRVTADFSLQDSYSWYVGSSSESSSFSGNTNGGTGSGARCSWLTGLRRELSSPVFQSSDIFLTYLGRESAARSFESWRTSLCGGSGGGAIAVLQPGDSFVFALRRIMI